MIQQLKTNLESVRQRMAAAAQRAGRDAAEVKLVAVTKYVDAATTEVLFDAGCHDLGEGRPQVLWEKAAAIDRAELKWHMVGHLQRNKVSKTVAHTSLIHSVDSNRLLNSINAVGAQLGRPINVLLQLNISDEGAKHGYDEASIRDALVYVASLKNVCVQGLMGMAGLGISEEETRQQFAQLRKMREALACEFNDDAVGIRLDELSMGMSADFEIAIEEGATIVRVGSVLLEGVA